MAPTRNRKGCKFGTSSTQNPRAVCTVAVWKRIRSLRLRVFVETQPAFDSATLCQHSARFLEPVKATSQQSERYWERAMDIFSVPAMLVGVLIHMSVGAVWYSPKLFGDAFMKLAYPKTRGPSDPDPSHAMALAMIGSVIHIPILCLILSTLGASSCGEGMLWGIVLSLLDAGLHASHHAFEERPVGLYALHQGYHTVSLIATGFVLGGVFSAQE